MHETCLVPHQLNYYYSSSFHKPPVDFSGYEQYLPPNLFEFDGSEIWEETANIALTRGLRRWWKNKGKEEVQKPIIEEGDLPELAIELLTKGQK